MINLSKRLESISSLIKKEDDVLDVGCDHALLDIYLSNKYNKKYYASDLRESALDMARANIKKYNAKNVVLKCANGLEKIDECDVNTVVISGMGYMSIMHILKHIKYIKKINKLVIQSNSNPEKVRNFLLKNNFYMDKEILVLDKNIYYIITSYKRGYKKFSKIDKEIGIFNDNDTKKYIDLEIKKNNVLLKVVPKKYIFKRLEIKKRLKYLDKKRNLL